MISQISNNILELCDSVMNSIVPIYGWFTTSESEWLVIVCNKAVNACRIFI